jgi:hypothetical protein
MTAAEQPTTLEALEARLAELEARAGIGVAPLAANPPITVGSLANVPAPGSPISSPWAQDVSNRIFHRFAGKVALDAWTPAEGARAYTVDQGRDWIRVAGGWQSINNYLSNGRTGVILIDSPQTFNTGVAADITWTAAEIQDVDNWATVGVATLTVPAGRTGRYLISYSGAWTGGAPGAAPSVVLLDNGVQVADVPVSPGTFLYAHQLTILRTLAGGDTLKLSAYQNGAGNRDLTSRLEITMLAA